MVVHQEKRQIICRSASLFLRLVDKSFGLETIREGNLSLSTFIYIFHPVLLSLTEKTHIQSCAPPLVPVVASYPPPLLPSFVSLSPSGSVVQGPGPLPLIAGE